MTSQHCNDGLTPEETLLSGHLVENDSTQSQTYKESSETTNKNSRKRQRSATPPESETTLNDKSKISDITQNTKLSTEDTRVLLPFWNKCTQEESRKWWLPKRFEFSFYFDFYCLYYLLIFLLGLIELMWTRACGIVL